MPRRKPKRLETLETAKELANRVGNAVFKPDTPVQVPKKYNPKTLDMDNIYKAVERIQEVTPDMVESMIHSFFGTVDIPQEDEDGNVVIYRVPRAKTTDRINIFKTLSEVAAVHERVKEGFGLLRDAAKDNGGSISLNQFNITQIRNIPGAVDRELRKLAEGE